jgi:hypothetical protein
MYSENLTDNINLMADVDVITREQVQEQVKADAEANLVAAGTWEGQVISWSKVEEQEKGEQNQFKGVSLYRVGVLFYDCPEMGKKKSQFFNFTPSKVLNESGRPKAAYTTLVGMVKALNMEGHPIPDVLEQAKVTRCKYKVGQFTTSEGNTVNFLKAVSTV